MTENGDVNVVSGNLETNSTGQLENINVTNADDILNGKNIYCSPEINQ